MNPETGELHVPQNTGPKDHAADVPELTDDTFDEVYRSDKNVLVLFYAPCTFLFFWISSSQYFSYLTTIGCEHSQEMFETWENVAVEYKNIDSVKVVQMDAHEAKRPGVSVFPTVKYVYPHARCLIVDRLFPAGHDNKIDFANGIVLKGKELSVKNIAGFVAANAKYVNAIKEHNHW